MNPLDLLVWVGVPYAAIAVFVVGHAWRWRHDQFGWTTRSSQLQESRLLAWGSPIFHYATFAAIAGHVLGILVPSGWTSAVGIDEHAYHVLATVAGSIAGVLVVVGLVILIYRRITVARVAVTSTMVDVAAYLLLAIAIAGGLLATLVNLSGGGYDYRQTVAIWFRSIMFLNPQPAPMITAPLLYQLHAVSAWLVLGLWPFSRLVHAWSVPWAYVGRPWILYRSQSGRTLRRRLDRSPRGAARSTDR